MSSQTIGADPSVVRFDPVGHRYYRGDKQLASVSSVLRVWPRDPCPTCHWPMYSDHDAGCSVKANIDNARERGIEVDSLFSAWLTGRLTKIPAGTRTDSKERFLALVGWWRKWWRGDAVTSQLMVADSEVAGTMDLSLRMGSPAVIDLKNVSAIDPAYRLQLGGYAELYEAQFGIAPTEGALIHVTQPAGKPVNVKYVEVDLGQALKDWKALRALWSVARRFQK